LIASYGLNGEFKLAQEHFIDAVSWCQDAKNDYFLVNTIVLASMSMTIKGRLTGRRLAMSALEVAERIANPSSIAWSLCAAADAERLASPRGPIHLEKRFHSRDPSRAGG
jgi:hypothetical protein